MSLLVAGALHWDVVVRAPRLPELDETLRGQEVAYQFGGKGGNQRGGGQQENPCVPQMRAPCQQRLGRGSIRLFDKGLERLWHRREIRAGVL